MRDTINNSNPTATFSGPYYLSIAGKLVSTEASFDVFNPATGSVLAQAPAATADQLDEAIAAARASGSSNVSASSWRR